MTRNKIRRAVGIFRGHYLNKHLHTIKIITKMARKTYCEDVLGECLARGSKRRLRYFLLQFLELEMVKKIQVNNVLKLIEKKSNAVNRTQEHNKSMSLSSVSKDHPLEKIIIIIIVM